MTDVKISEEQLTTLRDLQNDYDVLTKRYGELTFELKALEHLMMQLHANRQAIVESLQTQYGVGEVDLTTGTFKSVKE